MTFVVTEESVGHPITHKIKGECSLTWILDSGASHHFYCNRNFFVGEIRKFEGGTVKAANNQRMTVEGIGSVKINALVNGRIQPFVLTDVRYVPGMGASLLSIKQAKKKKLTLTLNDGIMSLWSGKLKVLDATGTTLYEVHQDQQRPQEALALTTSQDHDI